MISLLGKNSEAKNVPRVFNSRMSGLLRGEKTGVKYRKLWPATLGYSLFRQDVKVYKTNLTVTI